jgi:hypothetical protein
VDQDDRNFSKAEITTIKLQKTYLVFSPDLCLPPPNDPLPPSKSSLANSFSTEAPNFERINFRKFWLIVDSDRAQKRTKTIKVVFIFLSNFQILPPLYKQKN